MGDNRPAGPLGIDPLNFSITLFGLLLLFVLYLLLPRGLRVHHFRAYPKRYAWSARPRQLRRQSQVPPGPPLPQPSNSVSAGPMGMAAQYGNQDHRQGQPLGMSSTIGGAATSAVAGSNFPNVSSRRGHALPTSHYSGGNTEESVVFEQGGKPRGSSSQQQQGLSDMHPNDEIVISAAMQQLREPGVLIIAHGSRGKPKSVRLQLTEQAITWRTETRKKTAAGFGKEPKMGKLHSVPLSNIMYVDVGKQTTALRRVENASISESLCFSLLTKEGSLDLEANSPRERDALVSCFSLVLDEVHAQNWRDIYRGASSDMPSSFDDYDEEANTGAGP